MSGPPRKPNETKILQGTFRKDRAPKNMPLPTYGIPEAPSFLGDDEKKVWDLLAPMLNKMGVLASSDQLALAALCDATATWQNCIKFFNNNDLYYESKTALRAHPMLRIKDQSWKTMLQLLDRFGLNPAFRSKIEARPRTRYTDEFDDFLNSIDPK